MRTKSIGKTDIEQLNERLSEMSAVEKICSALDWEDVVGWNEDTQAVTITGGERALEGKEVYDLLFAEAADYVMMQTISGISCLCRQTVAGTVDDWSDWRITTHSICGIHL